MARIPGARELSQGMSYTASVPLDLARDEPTAAEPRPLVFRHKLATRIWHWVNAVAVVVMLMSGLMIFNAHPRLYWGSYGANFDKPWLEIQATPTIGYVQIGDARIDTTGVLGRFTRNGVSETRAFPGWATIPSDYNLALARRWHLAFAWVLGVGLLAFLIASLVNRHWKHDLTLSPAEIKPRHIWDDIKDHARLKFAVGDAALRYGILQKLSYIGVIFILLPVLIGTGLTMSPGMNAAWPWLLDLFGGRASARSLHFIAAAAMAGFIVVHIVLVSLTGPFNQVRGMIIGKIRLPKERAE